MTIPLEFESRMRELVDALADRRFRAANFANQVMLAEIFHILSDRGMLSRAEFEQRLTSIQTGLGAADPDLGRAATDLTEFLRSAFGDATWLN